MNNKYFIIAVLLVLSSFHIFSLKAQEISADNKVDKYVTKFDADGMAKKYLADFNLVEKRVMWNQGRRFVYLKENDQIKISIQVGLHPSAKDAEDIALDYLKFISMSMKKGQINGESIGDILWWWSPNSDQTNVTHILFIRKNALFMIYSYSYKEIKALAKAIDDDIINEEPYLSVEKSISAPKINSISMGKSNFRHGETSKITVHAMDPKNESLEYQFLPGITQDSNDLKNVFTFIATRDHLPEPFFGSHTIKAVVINASNVVSPVSEITINCIE